MLATEAGAGTATGRRASGSGVGVGVGVGVWARSVPGNVAVATASAANRKNRVTRRILTAGMHEPFRRSDGPMMVTMAPEATVRERLAALTAKGSLVREEGRSSAASPAGIGVSSARGRKGSAASVSFADGELRVPWGYVSSIAADPIEKKPFFHVRPGATALSFGMLGCDFKCPFCQNWEISQTLRDPEADAWAGPRPADAGGDRRRRPRGRGRGRDVDLQRAAHHGRVGGGRLRRGRTARGS